MARCRQRGRGAGYELEGPLRPVFRVLRVGRSHHSQHVCTFEPVSRLDCDQVHDPPADLTLVAPPVADSEALVEVGQGGFIFGYAGQKEQGKVSDGAALPN